MSQRLESMGALSDTVFVEPLLPKSMSFRIGVIACSPREKSPRRTWFK